MLDFGATHIFLRALKESDLDFLEHIENNEQLWHLSQTHSPFSQDTLKNYLANAQKDIYEINQLRLVICETESKNAVGFIDIYEFSPKNKRAGIGIIIDKDYQGKGYAKQALKVVLNYGFEHLDLHQFYAFVEESNEVSIKLFENCGFFKTGERKDWNYHHKKFHTEFIYQNINHVH